MEIGGSRVEGSFGDIVTVLVLVVVLVFAVIVVVFTVVKVMSPVVLSNRLPFSVNTDTLLTRSHSLASPTILTKLLLFCGLVNSTLTLY